MSLRLGDKAPNFKAPTTVGDIDFHQWLGDSWGVLFSHPKDFTPVCTTELGTVANLRAAFDARNVKTIALSVDDIESHAAWVPDINETQHTTLDYPIIGDHDRVVATLYDMIHPNANDTLTARSVFVIDPNKTIRLIITYPASTGRNFKELLRVIDSLQLTDNYGVATPADWQNGDDVIVVPSISTQEAKRLFPKGVNEVKPYLRTTPQPNK